ncbi:MAG: hypothetical protein ACYC6O_01550 [Thermoleophilia bacterium]
MYLLKFGAWVCVVAGTMMAVLAFIVPEAMVGLIIGSIGCFAAAAIDFWFFRFFSPVMKNLPRPEGIGKDEDITSLRGSMRMNKAMRREGIDKMESATANLKEMNRSNHLREHGMKARAEVLAMRDSGQMINFDPIVEFDLRIEPGEGESYQVEGYRQVVSKIILPRITTGGSYAAFTDPDEPNSLYINWQ